MTTKRLTTLRSAAVALALAVLAVACGDDDTTGQPVAPTTAAPTQTSAPATETPAPPTATEAPPAAATPTPVPPTSVPTSPPTSTPTPLHTADPPWAGPLTPQSGVETAVVTAWQDSTGVCPALYPTGVAGSYPDAVARIADFGPDDWGVAWDRPDGPGRDAVSGYCPDCGRSAFGVAAVRSDTVLDDLDGGLLGSREWADGSRIAWFYEGFAPPATGAPVLAYLEVAGYPCLYQVWSFLGESDLLAMIDGLRWVDGLGSGAPPDSAGPPPWSAPTLTLADLPSAYAEEWAEAGSPISCPCLALADLGEAADATIRRAENAGESLLAWDRPTGPGHDAQGKPCEDCGRGAVGLGTFQGGQLRSGEALVWDDGSEARIAPGLYGAEAWIKPAGATCVYWLWSHLGDQHLRYLLTQLRSAAT